MNRSKLHPMSSLFHNDPSTKDLRRRLRRDQTEVEKKLWWRLRNRDFLGLKFYRQYSVGPYILDFYCPELRLAIELDGGQHNETEGMQRDEARTKFLERDDIRVMRFWNNEVIENFHGVLEKLREEVERVRGRGKESNSSSLLLR